MSGGSKTTNNDDFDFVAGVYFSTFIAGKV